MTKNLIILYVAILIWIERVRAQIPKECGANFTLKTGVCCPFSERNHRICGYPDRGVCAPVEIYKEAVEISGFEDVRFHWPLHWFKNLCKCNGKYYGSSCDECWYGWRGEDCSMRHTVVRRDVRSYNETEKELFVKVVVSLREEESSYLLLKEAYRDTAETLVHSNIHEMLVNIHFYSQRPILTNDSQTCVDSPFHDFSHANVGFLTFHRQFILLWERWAAEVAQRRYGIVDFTFPYWDWTNVMACDVCTDDLVGSQGNKSDDGSFYLSTSNSFHSWTSYCDLSSPKRGFQLNNCAPCSYSAQSSYITRYVQPSIFPSLQHVTFTLSRKLYFHHSLESEIRCLAFHKALEGACGDRKWKLEHTMHNALHNGIFGAFYQTTTSPNDPLFLLHHTQIDRIFQHWWTSHPDSAKMFPNLTVPGHCFLCNQVGFIPVVTHKQFFVDTLDLGYEYDSNEFGGHI